MVAVAVVVAVAVMVAVAVVVVLAAMVMIVVITVMVKETNPKDFSDSHFFPLPSLPWALFPETARFGPFVS